LLCNFLGAKVLLDSDWVVGSTFVGKVICKNHALLAVYHPNSGDNITGRDTLLKTGELSYFEEGGALVHNSIDTFAGR
jgi:hypothetical protein